MFFLFQKSKQLINKKNNERYVDFSKRQAYFLFIQALCFIFYLLYIYLMMKAFIEYSLLGNIFFICLFYFFL